MISQNTALLFINSLGNSNACSATLAAFSREIETELMAGVLADPMSHSTTTIGQLVKLIESPTRKGEEHHRFIAVVHGVDCYFDKRSDAHSVARHMAELEENVLCMNEYFKVLPTDDVLADLQDEEEVNPDTKYAIRGYDGTFLTQDGYWATLGAHTMRFSSEQEARDTQYIGDSRTVVAV